MGHVPWLMRGWRHSLGFPSLLAKYKLLVHWGPGTPLEPQTCQETSLRLTPGTTYLPTSFHLPWYSRFLVLSNSAYTRLLPNGLALGLLLHSAISQSYDLSSEQIQSLVAELNFFMDLQSLTSQNHPLTQNHGSGPDSPRGLSYPRYKPHLPSRPLFSP